MDSNTRYSILCKGDKIYTDLTEDQYFDIMEDLAQSYYETGSPEPIHLKTEITRS